MTVSRLALIVPLLVGGVACSGGSDEAVVPEGETWCDVVAVANSLDDAFDDVDPDNAGALRSILQRIDELGPRFRAAAPSEIESQVDAYAEANSRLVAEIESVDYDMTAVDEEAFDEIVSSVDGIDAEIDEYTVAECGEWLGPDNR